METSLPAYIKFSKPVLFKALWAATTIPESLDRISHVLMAYRLGTETVWTTESIVDDGTTIDITSRGLDGHAPLRACDEIAIFSTNRGLRIVSIEFEEIEQQVLVPAVVLSPSPQASGYLHKVAQSDAHAITNRQLISLKEAVESNHQIVFPPRNGTNAKTRAISIAEIAVRGDVAGMHC
jgi:hypothetical protein